MNDSRKPSAAAGHAELELPELELELVPPRESADREQDYFDGAAFGEARFDEQGILDDGTSFSIATDADETRPKARGPAPGHFPAARTADSSAHEIGAHEIESAAGYGPPPASWLLSPLYAYRVATRQRQLRRHLFAIDAELRQAEAERDFELSELTLSLKPTLARSERFRALFAAAGELDRVANERDDALSLASSEYETALAELDAELAAIQVELDRRTAIEQALGKTFASCEAQWKRADAKLKRTNIEIRNLVEAARQRAGTQASLPPEKARLLTELNERLATQRAEATRTRDEHDRAQAEVGTAQHEREELGKRARRIEQHKAALEQKHRKRFDTQHRDLSAAEAARVAALAEIGRTLLSDRGQLPIEPAALSAIREADLAVAELSRKAAVQLRALDAYDRDAVKQGRSSALFVAAAILLSIVVKLAL